MKIIFTIITLFIGCHIHAQFAQWDWVSSGAGYNSDARYNFPAGNSVCVDAAHNVYVVGLYYDSLQLDTYRFAGIQNMFLAKYNAEGKLLWAKNATGSGRFNYSCGNALNVDDEGNIYIGGNFMDTMQLDNTQLVSASELQQDIFIAKYNAAGNLLWAKSAGGPGTDVIGYGDQISQHGGGLKIDKKGYIYITGYFSDSAKFDTIQIKSGTNSNVFLAKYDTSGHIIWVKKSKSTGQGIAFDLALDNGGNIFVTGAFSTDIIFDTIKLTIPPAHRLPNPYNFMFVTKYNAAGDVLWARAGAAKVQAYGSALVADQAGNVIVTGLLVDTAVFDTIILPSGHNNNNSFIAKYNAGGSVVWAKSMDKKGSTENYPNYMSIDANDNIYIIGDFKDTCTFDNKTIRSNGGYDIYVTRYGSDGSLQWVTSMGGGVNDAGFGITTDNTGAIYVTGNAADTCVFGNYSIEGNRSNMFVAKVTAPNTSIQQVLPTREDIYVYPNPANNTIHIQFAAASYSEVRVTDCLGRVMCTQLASGQEHVLVNTGAFAAGIYFVTAYGAGGSVSEKFVVEH